MWLPVFIAFFVLIADASFLFYGQNKTYRIVQDANRLLSTGYITADTDAEAEQKVQDYVLAKVSGYAPHASVVSHIELGQINTAVQIPGADLVATNLFTSFLNLNIVSSATHYIEY